MKLEESNRKTGYAKYARQIPYNFFKFLKCPALSNLQAQRFLNSERRNREEQARRKIEETTHEVSDHDN